MNLRRRFNAFMDEWEHDMMFHSSVTLMMRHASCAAIVDMGPPAIPLLLERCSLDDPSIYADIALIMVTGVHPPDEISGRIAERNAFWLEWGHQEGLLRTVHTAFTGSRRGATLEQHDAFVSLLERLGVRLLTHGDCTGWDAHAHECCMELGIDVRIMPSTALTRAHCDGGTVVSEPKAPLERNVDIVEDSADGILIACPAGMSEEQRSGTWHAIRCARRLSKHVYIVWPDGSMTDEGVR